MIFDFALLLKSYRLDEKTPQNILTNMPAMKGIIRYWAYLLVRGDWKWNTWGFCSILFLFYLVCVISAFKAFSGLSEVFYATHIICG